MLFRYKKYRIVCMIFYYYYFLNYLDLFIGLRVTLCYNEVAVGFVYYLHSRRIRWTSRHKINNLTVSPPVGGEY